MENKKYNKPFDDKVERAFPKDVRVLSAAVTVTAKSSPSLVDVMLPMVEERKLSYRQALTQTPSLRYSASFKRLDQPDFELIPQVDRRRKVHAILIERDNPSVASSQSQTTSSSIRKLESHLQRTAGDKVVWSTFHNQQGKNLKAAILASLATTAKAASQDDAAIVYYRGPGCPTGKDLLVDIDCGEGWTISAVEIYQTFLQKLPRHCKVTLIWDICGGGSVVDMPYAFSKERGYQENPIYLLEGGIFGKYKNDKWYASANIFFVGEREDLLIGTFPLGTSSTRTLDAFTDVNLNGGYHFNDFVSVFVKLNNVLNNNYERFANFQVQGFQVLGGVTYKFDF